MNRDPLSRHKARCPECLAPIWLPESAAIWDPVTCPECHTPLEVISLHPLRLNYMPIENEETWEEWDEEEA